MEHIQLTVAAGVATLTLARPERKNALSGAMREEIAQALESLRRNPEVRALVLTGAGGAFCSGGDFSSISKAGDSDGRGNMREIQRMWSALVDFDKPVVAAVEGAAYGAGFSLALAADLVVAADDARFCLSFAKIGLVPDLGALHTLPRMIGLQRTRELVYSARELGAAEARELGLVLEVLPRADVLPRAVALAASLATGSPAAFSMAKQMLARTFEVDREALLEMEANAQALCFNTAYVKEAATRFMKREAPLFRWPEAKA